MSLINYEHVGRIKTTTSHLRAASSARTRNKQRKWRVLLSIGLLLPALAAIIGIVAWAISIEVANTSQSPQSSALTIGQSSSNSNNHLFRKYHTNNAAAYHHSRRHHGTQQQQQQQQTSNELNPPSDQSKETGAADSKVSTPVEETPQSDARVPNGPVPVSGSNGKATQRAQLSRRRAHAAAGGADSPAKTKSESVTGDGRSSELLLTNLGQVEALSGSSSHDLSSNSNAASNGMANEANDENESNSDKAEDSDRKISESDQSDQEQGQQQMSTEAPVPVKAQPERDIQGDNGYQAGARGKSSSQSRSSWPKPIKTNWRAAEKSPSISEDSALQTARGAQKDQQESTEVPSAAARQAKGIPNDRTELRQQTSSFKSNKAKLPSRVSRHQAEQPMISRYTIENKEAVEEDSSGSEPESKPADTSEEAERHTGATSGAASVSGEGLGIVDEAPMSQQAIPFRRPEDEQRNRYIPQEHDQNNKRDEELSFEAIASAISTTLSANSQQEASKPPEGGSIDNVEEDDSPAGIIADSEDLTEQDPEPEGGDSPSRLSSIPVADRPSGPTAAARRRLTPGEHVAEVIDHIVERRKQSSGAISGPQIVVVAPVGGSQMKARSLTKASVSPSDPQRRPVADTKASLRKPEDHRVINVKKEAILNGNNNKKPRRTTKPLAARLLGVGNVTDAIGSSPLSNLDKSSGTKFSERVEVIEDDDSSAFLFKSPSDSLELPVVTNSENDGDGSIISSRRSGDSHQESESTSTSVEAAKTLFTLEQLLQDQELASSHISHQPSEPRHRSPRHGGPVAMAFERYEPIQSERKSATLAGPRIYSAEKLISEHLLMKSAAALAPKSTEEIKRSSGQEFSKGPQPTQIHQQPKNQQQQQQQQQQPQPTQQNSTPNKQVKIAPTTVRPHQPTNPSTGPASAVVSGQQKQVIDSRQQPMMGAASDQLQMHAIQMNQFQNQQEAQKQTDTYLQTAPDNQRQIINYHQPAQSHPLIEQQQRQQQLHNNQHQQSQNEGQQSQQQVDQQTANGQAQALPVFADQEYNVPAHMAESVIHNIQMSPVTMSMVNGHPTLVGGMSPSGHQQVPPQHQFPYSRLFQQQHQQHQYLQNLPPQQQQQILHQQFGPIMQSASEQQPAWQRLSGANNKLQQQHKSFFQRQGRSDSSPSESWIAPKSISSLNPTKALVNPLAQMALRHLISSIAGGKATVSLPRQEAPTLPISIKLAPQPVPEVSSQSTSSNSMTESHKSARSAEMMPTQNSGPLVSSLDSMGPTSSGATGPQTVHSMGTSSGISGGDVVAASHGAPRETVDQDMEESYGQMPAYQMPPPHQMPHYGGGGNYPYQGYHDKKSKGITFHFGGGPIGGGTQLITSPMGIFKHLMIPLLPNPRVNLNGKVVFGVVLEKSTAIGEPKKKYKFWGR